MERDIGAPETDSVLELGVNRGEHLEFVTQSVGHYVATDFRLTSLEHSKHSDVLTQAVCSAEDLPFVDACFDRVIVTCLLHHLAKPYEAVRECRRVLRPGGTFSLLLPCDPGIAYRLAWSLTSQRRLRRLGIPDPQMFHALEHPQHFEDLYPAVRKAFSDCEINEHWWPLRLRTWNFNLFVTMTIYT